MVYITKDDWIRVEDSFIGKNNFVKNESRFV